VFVSRYMPCEYCGESLDRTARQPHQCSPERRAIFQMWALRAEIATFEKSYLAFLDTPQGRFEVWLAARDLREGR
jgi:hypothetical protein